MHIMRLLATAVFSVALLIPGTVSAAVVLPALDIQLYTGDKGAVLTGNTSFDIDATAFAIVNESAPSIDIPNQAFKLNAIFDGNYFTGTFNVGGLLSGSFDDMVIKVLSSGAIDFEANLTYDSGSLKGNLLGGRLEGIGSASDLSAKLGPVTVVPVPAAAWLFGSGLIGLIGIARRKV